MLMATWTLLYLLCRIVGYSCADEAPPEVTQPEDRVFKTLDTIRVRLTSKERQTLQELIARDRASGRAQTMRPLVIIPAFASSRLRVWQTAGCKDGITDFRIGGDSWLDLAMYFASRRCWLNCIELDPLTQDDAPACKSRPDEGLDAVTELSPGIITGPLSSVWKSFIDMAASLGYEPHRTLIAAPYDFRLAPLLLEKRDGYFSRLKFTIEHAVHQAEKNGDFDDGSAIIVAHSLGNVMFHYFTEWLKADLGLFNYRAWLDKYVHTFIASAPPVLGAAEGLLGIISGITFGLPRFPLHEARHLGATFGSSHMMTPVARKNVESPNYDAMNPAARPAPLFHVEIPETGEKFDFDVDEVRSGVAFRRLSQYDDLFNQSAEQLARFYDRDPVADVVNKPWPRPPIKRVVCAYGVGVKTTLAFKVRKSETAVTRSNGTVEKVVTWDAYDILSEQGVPRQLRWSSGAPVEDSVPQKAGDGTVPYESLSWCHSWLGRRVNITRVPQETHYADEEIERFIDVAVNHTLPPKRHPSQLYNVFYEDARWDDERRLEETSVWELDRIPHRGLMESESILQLVKTELLSSHLQHLSFRELKREMADREQVAGLQARTESRCGPKPPSSDDECEWDYARAECKWSKFCGYDYRFGDLSLSQSCRLKKKTTATEAGETEDKKKLPLCKCINDECMSGFCKYEDRCEQAVMAFGPSNGWWGPCSRAEKHLKDSYKGKPEL